MKRRQILVGSLGAAAALGIAWPAIKRYATEARHLLTPNQDQLRLLPGFSSRIIARSREKVSGTDYTWHAEPDGGAVFAAPDGGWVYVSNSELDHDMGGVGMVRFDRDANIIDAQPLLVGTNINCAGGATPWNTWLSCEEHPTGLVWECDPFAVRVPFPRPALGVFQHEAAAVDAKRRLVYLTEDEVDGLLYRFVSDAWPSLDRGKLQVLAKEEGELSWVDVPDPQAKSFPTRYQVKSALTFNGGEGAWLMNDTLYFTTKGDDRVWSYAPSTNKLEIIYDASDYFFPRLSGVDNIVGDDQGILYVAEDGGDMQLVALFPSGEVMPILQVEGTNGSEITGPAFDPSGTRLYFSSQRDPGVTYEVSGPFAELGPVGLHKIQNEAT